MTWIRTRKRPPGPGLAGPGKGRSDSMMAREQSFDLVSDPSPIHGLTRMLRRVTRMPVTRVMPPRPSHVTVTVPVTVTVTAAAAAAAAAAPGDHCVMISDRPSPSGSLALRDTAVTASASDSDAECQCE